jgi:hypothetical protein
MDGCKENAQVFLSSIFAFYHSPPSSAKVKDGGAIPPLPHMSSWHSAYHFLMSSVAFSISLIFLTGLLWTPNTYHIIPIFITSSSFWFSPICLSVPQQFFSSSSSSPLSRIIYVLVFKVFYIYKLLSYQQGSF